MLLWDCAQANIHPVSYVEDGNFECKFDAFIWLVPYGAVEKNEMQLL
jgi:hypothetical protein